MKIVIAGGGTAGWLSALFLAKQNLHRDEPAYDITVIESEDIPIIGAGEGSTGVLQKVLLSTLTELEGFGEKEVFPSPNDQLHDTGLVDVSWKFTSIGKHPFSWSRLNPAFALFTVIVSVVIWLVHPLSVMDRDICLSPGLSNWSHTLSPELSSEAPDQL